VVIFRGLNKNNKLTRGNFERSGMALYLVLSVVVIMGLMMPVYFYFSNQITYSSFAQLNEDRLFGYSRIIHETVFAYVREKCNDPNHKIFKFLKNSLSNTNTSSWSQSQIKNDVPELFSKLLPEVLPEEVTQDRCDYEISFKVVDKTKKNADGANYYSGEGLGALEVTVVSSLYRKSKLLSSCRHIRRYDFKNACLAAFDQNKYSMGFPLRYPIFVRNARMEHNPPNGDPIILRLFKDSSKSLSLKAVGDVYTEKTGPLNAGAQSIAKNGNPVTTKANFYNYKNRKINILQTGGDKFRPFRHCSLFSARFLTAKEFYESGIYDTTTGNLHLPGIIEVCKGGLDLKSPAGGKITIFGRGAILSPDGITINSEIKLNDKNTDICVFFTRGGHIRIKTQKDIQAALLAFNDSRNGGVVSDNGPFSLYGCLGVDLLFPFRRALECTIEYDPRFRPAGYNEEIFSISVLPWVKLENKRFSRKDLL
jgi:hypothetical protein